MGRATAEDVRAAAAIETERGPAVYWHAVTITEADAAPMVATLRRIAAERPGESADATYLLELADAIVAGVRYGG